MKKFLAIFVAIAALAFGTSASAAGFLATQANSASMSGSSAMVFGTGLALVSVSNVTGAVSTAMLQGAPGAQQAMTNVSTFDQSNAGSINLGMGVAQGMAQGTSAGQASAGGIKFTWH